MATDEEQKNVTRDQLGSGVQLTAGHRVVLILGGGTKATTTSPPEAPAPSSTTTAAPEGLSTTTTALPETTTEEPQTTTTLLEASSTTAAPEATTTTQPSSSTTGAPSTTTVAAQPTTTTTSSGKAEVVVALDQAVTDLLPDGVLVLSGDGIDEQQKAFAEAEKADGVLRFDFTWDDPKKTVKLEARAGGNSVVLWDDQPAGDPEAQIVWSGVITDLYKPEDAGSDTAQSIGSSPDDLDDSPLEDLL